MSDYKKFKKDKKKAKKLFKKWWGKKCPEYDQFCIQCCKWKQFKDLYQNPFYKDE